MKKILLLITLGLVLTACGTQPQSSSEVSSSSLDSNSSIEESSSDSIKSDSSFDSSSEIISKSSEPITSVSSPSPSTPSPSSSSSKQVEGITVAEALTIAKQLPEGGTSSQTYTINAYVSNGFDPKESTQTAGQYNFDVVDSQGGDKLIVWYLSGNRLPIKGEAVTINSKLQHYVDKSSVHKYECVEGSFTVGGAPTPTSSSSSEPISSSYYPSTSSTSVIPPIDDPNWTGLDFNTYGATFRNKLASLIKNKVTKTTSYSNCLSIGAKAAAYPKPSSNTFVPFYHTTDTVVTTSGCNREHTWPDSRGGGQIETDPFVIRPTIEKDNSSRGNAYYGTKEDNKNYWDPACLGFEGARGESARVILYAATKYYTLMEGLDNRAPSPNEPAASAKKMMGKLSSLMEWNAKYPVTDMERQINNYLSSQGYGRNPFVDHPEYANWIWDNNGLITHSPSGNSSAGSSYTTSSSMVPTQSYNLVTSLTDLTQGNVAIVATPDTYSYYAMSSEAKRDDLPYYILSNEVEVSNDKSKMYTTSLDGVGSFQIIKQTNGYYSIYNTVNKHYLYNYVNQSHYNIAYDVPSGMDASSEWIITKEGDGFVFKGVNSPYLDISSQTTYCGAQNKPSRSLLVYALS